MAMFTDGKSTTITIDGITLTAVSPKSMKPPGFEGGGAIDTTTMDNTAMRTRAPKSLADLTDCTLSVAYDASAYELILASQQVNAWITVVLPDTASFGFYGWIESFVPGDATEGEQPMADITLIASNVDATGAEVSPVFCGSGTTTTGIPTAA